MNYSKINLTHLSHNREVPQGVRGTQVTNRNGWGQSSSWSLSSSWIQRGSRGHSDSRVLRCSRGHSGSTGLHSSSGYLADS